jgi:nitrite reductase/ring-hydroxylating ferredoxin subunit
MADWVPVCRLDEIPAGRGRVHDVLGLRLAVFRAGVSIVALLDRCPHSGGSLGQGWIEEGEVVCPLHRWRFRLSDGRCSTMQGHGVHRFPAEIRQDHVWVMV